MEDNKIVKLYLDRNEEAIKQSQIKYGNYCYAISYNILKDNQDVEECLSDTYLKAWNLIPPNVPKVLSTFLGKIIRRLSIDKYRKNHALKRNSEYTLSLQEIGECIGKDSTKEKVDEKQLTETINSFLAKLNKESRNIFVCRYYYFDSIEDIQKRFNCSESKVKMSLKRTRDSLKDYLIKEGYSL